METFKQLCSRYASDNNYLNGKVSIKTGSTLLDQNLALYDSCDPVDFISCKFTLPVPKTEELFIYNMMSNYRLGNGIMNAILDYMFEKSNNTFVKNFLESLCSFVARQKPANAFETYKLLRQTKDYTNQSLKQVDNYGKSEEELLNLLLSVLFIPFILELLLLFLGGKLLWLVELIHFISIVEL